MSAPKYDRQSLGEHPGYANQRPPRTVEGCVAEHTGHAHRFFGRWNPITGRPCVCHLCWAMQRTVAVTVARGCSCPRCVDGRQAVAIWTAKHPDLGRPLKSQWVLVALKPRSAQPLPQVRQEVAQHRPPLRATLRRVS